jgi:CHASE2 domain-containing sensor protein
MGAFKVIWSRIRGKNVKGSYSRARIFWWAVAISLVCGIIKMGAPLEDSLRTGRNWLRQHPASGNIVVVGIDNKSLKKLEKWPWPRRHHGELAEKLGQLGAKRIFFDLDFSSRTDRAKTALLRELSSASTARSRWLHLLQLIRSRMSGPKSRRCRFLRSMSIWPT